MPIDSGLMNVHTAGTLYLFGITHVDGLFMRFTGVEQQGKVRLSLTNEAGADKLLLVFEAFRFDSQVGFL